MYFGGGECDGFTERCRFWASDVVLRGSVVNFAGKWCISGGSIAALGRNGVILGKWWYYGEV